MASIRRILSIFSRETNRPVMPLRSAEDLIAFVQQGQDPHAIDLALQQAGRAPFWPQDPRMSQFYQAAQADRHLAARLKAVADLGIVARRHRLAHLQMAPDPLTEAHLPQRYDAYVHLVAVDAALPERTRSFLRRMRQPQSARIMGNTVARDILSAFGGDISRAIASGDTPERALRALLAEQMGDILRAWLRTASGGALGARLDAAIQNIVATPAHFAKLRVEIAASTQLGSAGRSGGMAMVDIVDRLLQHIEAAVIEPLFVCRDDRTLIQRGFGERRHISRHVIYLDDAMTAQFDQLNDLFNQTGQAAGENVTTAAADDSAQTAGLAMVTAETATLQLIDCQHPSEALAEMAIFARVHGQHSGNKGLRHYWQRHEDAGIPSRIGAQMGLALGDLQNLYEHLTRRDIYDMVPDVRRLQDRLLARTITAPATTPADGNDSA